MTSHSINNIGDPEKQDAFLKSATAWQRKPKQTAIRAGLEIVNYLERCSAVSKKANPVIDAFKKAAGTNFLEYCSPERYEKGVLYVRCLPGPVMHQLRTEQAKIIEEIKAICPTARLRALRFIAKN